MKGPLRKLIEQVQEWRGKIPTGGYSNHDSSVYDSGKESGYDSVLDTAEMLLAHRGFREEAPRVGPKFPLEWMDLPARQIGMHLSTSIHNRESDGSYCRGQVLQVQFPGTHVRVFVCARCKEDVDNIHVRRPGGSCDWCDHGTVWCERSGGTMYPDRKCERCGGTGKLEIREGPPA